MTKKYIKPEINVVKLQLQEQMLTASGDDDTGSNIIQISYDEEDSGSSTISEWGGVFD